MCEKGALLTRPVWLWRVDDVRGSEGFRSEAITPYDGALALAKRGAETPVRAAFGQGLSAA